ncbi:MAG: chloride channel protein [Gammaproteobacteria bacterium]|nr:MAG: chloride channel protein [Gammaproteobacteria bacterium]
MDKQKKPQAKNRQQSKGLLKRPENLLHNFRLRLAHTEALPQLAILGILSGFATGLVAVMFRLGIEWPLQSLLPGHDSENFEGLPLEIRFLLPFIGAIVIGAIFYFNPPKTRSVGVGHVIERYHHHQADLPLRNVILQFIGGILAAVSGHSVGREGPAVHLGAASSSLLGQLFKLPNNSLRILVGCGVASAIAASFNTPLAGVILAMEVVLMEYTITGFIPVILAAVCGAVTSRIFFGNTPAFDIPSLAMVSLLELPFLALCGVIVGLASAAMLSLHRYTLRLRKWSLPLRMLGAGLIAGSAGVLVPQVMGIGYDTLELAMRGDIGLTLLLTIVVAKLLTSTTTIALGIPGGSIGPTLIIGACLGGCLGIIGNSFNASESAAIGFYATVCMGAMMAGVLNAPLAALIALLELTYNPHILLPGMLVIVISCITARMVSRLPGLFLVGQQISQPSSPISQALNRIGVTSVMTSDFIAHSRYLPQSDGKTLLQSHPEWVAIADIDGDRQNEKYLLRAADLSRYLQTLEQQPEHEQTVDLLEIPAERWRLYPIHPRATLHEAMKLIRQKNGYAVYVTQAIPALTPDIAGIITQERIDRYYQ